MSWPGATVTAPGHNCDYAWVIDVDHLAGEGAEPGIIATNAATVTGPRDAPGELLAALKDGSGIQFRMFDDDGELYYTGRFVPADLSDGEEGFGPLDDFGMPNAGAVTVKYKREAGWEAL